MKKLVSIVIVLAAIAAGIGGYLFWDGRLEHTNGSAARGEKSAASGPVLYYRDPDGKPFYSAEPKLNEDGRPWREVRASEDVNFDPPTSKDDEGGSGSKRILYYRNPMGLPDVSPTPKKDSMGMDYIPVYEGEDDDGSTVKVSPGKLQRTGVKSEPAEMRPLVSPVRAPGVLKLDERKISVVTMRAETFVEQVENITTGSEVNRGQPLMRVYSPAIASAAAQYLSALSGKYVETPGARQRLLNLAVPPEYIAEIDNKREVPQTFIWRAPRDGIVLERNVSDGMRAQPGDVLFRIADHSTIWAMVEVTERDLASIEEGQSVKIRVRSYPNLEFKGKVSLVYPHLNPATRTVSVRIELPNKDFLLRPDMYAEAEISIGDQRPVLTVPESALIDSGDRQIVIVDKSDGRFEPRKVVVGRRGDGMVEIREGLQPDEAVVTTANFLIDAESNLKSALKGLTSGSNPQ